MKTTLITLALSMLLSQVAMADSNNDRTYPGGCAGQLLGSCEEYDNGNNRVGPNNITCIARDASNQKFTYTGSYGRPTHENVLKAIAVCKAHSSQPSTCHSTACRWAD